MKMPNNSLPIVAALACASLLSSVSAGFGAGGSPDKVPPTLVVSFPAVNASIKSNALITVEGTAKDNVAVASVYYRLDGGDWALAVTTNHFADWTGSVTLSPGINTLQAYAVDTSNNSSRTNTVKFTYVVDAPLTVQVIGQGTVSPSDNGKMLQVGNTYTLTASPKPGFAFYKWTGSLTTNSARLSFTMESNLTFTANFVDVQRPVLAILSPAANAKVTGPSLTVTGRAGDNVGVVSVFCQLNGMGWDHADTANGYTNWTAALNPVQGANTVQAYAQDAAGNKSLTNTVKFSYTKSGGGSGGDWAPSSLSGLSAKVESAEDAPFTVAFGAGTFSQMMLSNGTNLDDNAVGTYAYTKVGTNTATLELIKTAPPSATNNAEVVVELTFTEADVATFVTTNQDGMVDTGTINLAQALNVAPASLSGKTYHSVSSWGNGDLNEVFSGTTATMTDPAHPNLPASGTYAYAQYSPVGGLCMITLTKPTAQAGDVIYLVVTFSASDQGSYYEYEVLTNGNGAPTDVGQIVP
jgi:uncharacterized repeat protein (TIGR02543 family)